MQVIASNSRQRIMRMLGIFVGLCVSVYLVRAGMQFRRWHYEVSQPIHFTGDMQNALSWGQRSVREGWVEVYSWVVRRNPDEKYGLDYPPLRLLVFNVWAHWLHGAQPGMTRWRHDYDINRPVLLLNAFMELSSAVLVYFLVSNCRKRAGKRFAGTLGILAAAFLWFNPQLLISSWGRPAWEVWVVPFYLLAILLASLDQWLISGIVLAVGGMFKGQETLVAVVFVLWPLLAGNLAGAARWTGGYIAGSALSVLPWMLSRPMQFENSEIRSPDPAAIVWVSGVLLVCLGVLVWRYMNPKWRSRWLWLLAIVPFIGFIWPIVTHHGRDCWWQLILLTLVAIALLRFTPWRYQTAIVAAALGISLFACIQLFHGTLDWYKVAFQYGATKFPQLQVGGVDSLAGIIQDRYHWNAGDRVGEIHFHFLPILKNHLLVINMGHLIGVLYVVLLIPCAWGLGYLHRQRDTRWLVAMAAPWIVCYAFAPQMHERYLLWGAAVGSVVLGADLGMSLLMMLVSIMSWMGTAGVLLGGSKAEHWGLSISPTFGRSTLRFIHQSYPSSGWLLILIAWILVYLSIKPGRKRSGRGRPPSSEGCVRDTSAGLAKMGENAKNCVA